jgi:ABC-2 type transport system permease protein/lipopolysaccharide transport system permease protein
MSVGSIVSIANVFFRDFSYVVNILLQMLFFLTPILYQKSKLGNVLSIAKINPIMHFIDLFRDPIYNGIFPSIETILFATFWCFFAYILSFILMNKCKQQIIFKL